MPQVAPINSKEGWFDQLTHLEDSGRPSSLAVCPAHRQLSHLLSDSVHKSIEFHLESSGRPGGLAVCHRVATGPRPSEQRCLAAHPAEL